MKTFLLLLLFCFTKIRCQAEENKNPFLGYKKDIDLDIGALEELRVYKYTWEELKEAIDTNVESFRSMMLHYSETFPCEDCRINIKREIKLMEKIFPLDLIESKKEAEIWLWLVHNHVNARLQKPWFPYKSF